MHHAARTTYIGFHPLKTRSHNFSSINMRVVMLWLLNDRLCLVIDSRSSRLLEILLMFRHQWPLTSYLIHKIHKKNILCGIEFQPINYAWDKVLFKSKRNRKWFFFWLTGATILSIWWDSNLLSMANFSCRRSRVE
jgi:hypothetical protein